MDTVANMLTIIRNGQMAEKETVKVPYSNFKFELAKFLEGLGFISGVEKIGKKEKRVIEISLKYDENKQGAISLIKKVSKPGRRSYSSYEELRWPKGSVLVVSTSKGLMTAEKSRKAKLGGELICLVS
ncbi:MAG: 30S ribosomal protein S8 [Parcubacteria group bacterium GW2011_GWC1_45_9]|nr:MAG: 30S ribosomal protein S8 [Parcubacteria group bacterium GW2011_GWA1_Parcubacteria_45_10]KKT88474.1 MAG: 30S ribosomal protein S8 [Parcubacteria group bacterium GW2011_GWB1_45_10]KKU17310.1 MAG: 30S ribosomal protein S8 [Parcubacteria group bacterium GW2011_GWC1_45_9]HCI05208.1 30S ribosomal protein S8 [Patescibacteria group bacterium]